MTSTLGIIAPHPPIMVKAVGRERSDITAASAIALGMARERLRAFDPDAIVLSSPHAPVARGSFLVRAAPASAGDFSQFGASEAGWQAPGHPELARAILAAADAADIPAAALEDVTADVGPLDHGVLVPMHFLDPEGRYPLVEVSLSFLSYDDHRRFGAAVAAAATATGLRVAYVASGDLSHRLKPDAPAGYSPRAADFDAELVRLVGAGDLGALADIDPALTEAAGECGLRSFIMLGGFLGSAATARVLHYESPWGVGYLTAVAGTPDTLREGSNQAPSTTDERGAKGGTAGSDESPHVRLARAVIEEYVRTGRIPDPPTDEPALEAPSAAFVSLHRSHELRGCIGSILPHEATLADEIVAMAVQAATQDPRFPPVDPDELPDLEISVDVLGAPEPIDGLDALDPSTYGVIVTSGFRRGLLLPDLEGIDTAEQQVSIARRKAGIGPDEPISLERFRVDRFH